MKLTTFCVDTRVGPVERFGFVKLDGGVQDTVSSARAGSGWVIDANVAYAGFLAHRGNPNASVRADRLCPADLNSFVGIYGPALDPLQEIAEWLDQYWESITNDGATALAVGKIAYRLNDVKLRPPIRVPVLRDFAAFEDHLQVTFGKMGLKIPPEWYDRPIAFKGNPTSLVGHDEPVRWPQYTQKLDYELELAAIIGLPARDVDVDDAAKHILGYTLLNDFSARDTQRVEMAMSTGPYKGKDFAWGLGPWIVTPDEFGEVAGTKMRVLVNGEVWAESTPGAMQWSFPEMIAYTSQDETANVGDVFGSGTVNNGCGFEIDRWIRPGDVVEIEAAGIGVLRNRIEPPRRQPVRWQRRKV
jgi:2-keto-4-pentenoate hydratase/2-oxohepta-3-ene-1,7-dioic acid hydratase in catechol pathway